MSATRPTTGLLVLAIGLLSSSGVIHGGQSSPPPGQGAPETPRFRVGVDVVRIDAVVTDADGRTVPNLTAADFEVRQDGKVQPVTFTQFMPVASGPAPVNLQPATATMAPAAAVADPVVRREEIQRTIAIVVDDLGLSFESFHGMRQALHAFVDRELRPADTVAVVRTGGAGGGLQPFTTDRRVLHSVIDGLQWNGESRNGIEPFVALNKWTTFGGGGPPGQPPTPPTIADPNDFTKIEELRSSMSAAGTLGALNLVVRGTRELPGRKAVILVTEGFQLLDNTDMRIPESRVRAALDRLVDQATRAGVVIYIPRCERTPDRWASCVR